MKRVEYFLKKMGRARAALVASPASGQDWDRPTAPGQFRSFAEEDSIRVVSEVNFMPLMRRRRIMTLNEKNLVLRSFAQVMPIAETAAELFYFTAAYSSLIPRSGLCSVAICASRAAS